MPVAQLVEHSPFKGVVLGSNPSGLATFFMKKKFYHKLGPVPTEEDLKHPKKLNPNKARNTVITWYSFVAIAIILYFVITKLF